MSKSIYNAESYQQLVARIEQLSSQTQGQWGKMNVAQMLAHCSQGLRMALGDIKPPRSFVGFLIGRFYKGMVTGAIKLPKNSPTSPHLKISDERDFQSEKQNVLGLLKRMNEGGEAGATTHPNPFFGKLTPSEWGQGQFHHLDYHLNQFGV